MIKLISISTAGNYYGSACLGQNHVTGTYYISVENFDGHYWEPVSDWFAEAWINEFGRHETYNGDE